MKLALVVDCWARCRRCAEVFIVRTKIVRSQAAAVRRIYAERQCQMVAHVDACPGAPPTNLGLRVPADVRIAR